MEEDGGVVVLKDRLKNNLPFSAVHPEGHREARLGKSAQFSELARCLGLTEKQPAASPARASRRPSRLALKNGKWFFVPSLVARVRTPWDVVAWAAVVVGSFCLVEGLALAEGAENPWATAQQLSNQRIGVTWSDTPLRSAIEGLAQAQRVAVLIDRRLDPGRSIELVLTDTPLEEAFSKIAQAVDARCCWVGPVAYFGPAPSASRLRTVIERRRLDARKLPSKARSVFFASKSLHWEDFATPRDLLQQLADQNGLRLSELGRVPHDLWAAVDLPPLPLFERLSLIAIQFDLTFRISPEGNAIALVPLPDDLGIVRSYPGGADPQATAKRFAALAPDARTKVVGDKVYVKGLLEDHERLAGRRSAPSLRPSADQQPAQATALDRLRIDKMAVANVPVGPLLEHLAKRFQLQLDIDREAIRQAGVSLDQLVSVNVKDATVDDLFNAVVHDTKLQYSRHGTEVEIRPADD